MSISCDSVAAHRAYATSLGGLPHPILSDFHPKGEVTKAYDIWNEERGAGLRALIVVDKNGDIIFREVYAPGKAPDPNDMLAAIEG